jgi:hypothetical protein
MSAKRPPCYAGETVNRRKGRPDSVKEIVRTNDAVLVSAITALLDGAGIRHIVLDQNMSVLEGSLGILPRRIMVEDDRVEAVRRFLAEAGFSAELRPQGG